MNFGVWTNPLGRYWLSSVPPAVAAHGDQDPSIFVSLLLQRSIEKYEAAKRSGRMVLFDRGIPDCVVYAHLAGADPEPSLKAVDVFRYGPQVLFVEPWSDIYTTDEERTMPFEDTASFSKALRDVYTRSGYSLVEVPQTPIDERVAFVRKVVSVVPPGLDA